MACRRFGGVRQEKRAAMPNIWFNNGLSCVRDALELIREAAGDRVRLVASHTDASSAVLSAADLGFVEPQRQALGGDAAYLDWCLATCRDLGVQLFAPQKGLGIVANHVDRFAAGGTKLSVPAGSETLALLEDKARFTARAASLGVPTPFTRRICDATGFDAALAAIRELGRAACIKPNRGIYGAGFWRLNPDRPVFDTLMNCDLRMIAPQEMRRAVEDAQARDGDSPAVELLVMEHLPGAEWSLDAVCRGGRLVVGVARRKAGRYQLLETEGIIFEYARTLARALTLSGLINFQFKAANEGDTDPRLLEINPRMSGGCALTRFSGVNLPWVNVALELDLIEEGDIPVPQAGARVVFLQRAAEILP